MLPLSPTFHPRPSPRLAPLRTLLIALLLLAFYFALRLPHLRDLPVYADEASYMRWAQLIRIDPLHNLFISMEDAKLPLHYWLLAGCYHLSPDPILSGRLFSVLCGALTLLLLFPLSTELVRLHKKSHPTTRLTPTLLAATLALFVITSPLLATYQRMALAESLLLLESLALATYSLRFARQLTDNPTAPQKSHLFSTLTLALLWTLPLLTKQDFSYLLWLFPPLALFLHHFLPSPQIQSIRVHPRSSVVPLLRRFLPLYTAATALALTLFIPVLFTSTTYPLSVRLFYKQAFYFSTAATSRTQIFCNNLQSLLLPSSAGHPHWWPHDPANLLSQGTLYLYLTPPLLLLLLAGTLALILKRTPTLLLFFAAWSALLLGPLCLNSNIITTRYALLGIAPLLFIAALITATCYAHLPKRLAPLFLIALLAWPLAATTWQTLDYAAPTALASDRWDYQTSCAGGYAPQQLTAYLTALAAQHPLTLITENAPASLADFPWLTLRNNPNIHLLCTPPHAAPISLDHPQLLSTEQNSPDPATLISLPTNQPIYQILPLAPDATGHFPNIPHLITLFPNPNSNHTPIFALALLQIPSASPR